MISVTNYLVVNSSEDLRAVYIVLLSVATSPQGRFYGDGTDITRANPSEHLGSVGTRTQVSPT